MSERPKELPWKGRVLETVPQVQILSSPPKKGMISTEVVPFDLTSWIHDAMINTYLKIT